MATLTDFGLEWGTDRWLDNASGRLDYIGVGSGSGAEANDATALANREYVAEYTNSNIEFVETGPGGEFEAIIRVKGGTEVPAGTELSEIGVYVGDPTADGNLFIIDEFNTVPVAAGRTEEFRIPVTPERS